MIDKPSISNNSVYNDTIEYKDRTCAGLNCKNRSTILFQMSLTIGYSFLCDDCKRSIEYDGWILNVIADTNDLRKISKRIA